MFGRLYQIARPPVLLEKCTLRHKLWTVRTYANREHKWALATWTHRLFWSARPIFDVQHATPEVLQHLYFPTTITACHVQSSSAFFFSLLTAQASLVASFASWKEEWLTCFFIRTRKQFLKRQIFGSIYEVKFSCFFANCSRKHEKKQKETLPFLLLYKMHLCLTRCSL